MAEARLRCGCRRFKWHSILSDMVWAAATRDAEGAAARVPAGRQCECILGGFLMWENAPKYRIAVRNRTARRWQPVALDRSGQAPSARLGHCTSSSTKGIKHMQLGMIGLGRMGANMVRGYSRTAMNAWCCSRRKVVEDMGMKSVGSFITCRPRQEAGEAARGLAHGPRRGRRQDHRRSLAGARGWRHDH